MACKALSTKNLNYQSKKEKTKWKISITTSKEEPQSRKRLECLGVNLSLMNRQCDEVSPTIDTRFDASSNGTNKQAASEISRCPACE